MSKDQVVTFRLTEAERAALLARADQQGITLSEFVRRAALRVLDPPPLDIQKPTTTVGGYNIVWLDQGCRG